MYILTQAAFALTLAFGAYAVTVTVTQAGWWHRQAWLQAAA
jgi:hypothetical protein